MRTGAREDVTTDIGAGERYTVGIDLGTTRTGVARATEDSPELIRNAGGEWLTPSVVHLSEQGTALVGREAEEKHLMNPDRTVVEIKRRMGEEDPIQVGTERFRPEELSALILEKVVADSEQRLGGQIPEAVITVPAYFTDRQRTATRNAGEIAGLQVSQLLPEPSAAVLAYGYEQQKLGKTENETLFVYDLGGGTFDATLVEAEYEFNFIETVLTDGDSGLGGADWTAEIEDWVISGIEEDTGVDIRSTGSNADQLNRIREAATEAKHKLTSQSATNVTVPFVLPQQGYSFERKLTRERFEEMTRPLLERTRETVDRVFEKTDFVPADVDTVLLVGGSSRMPQVAAMLESYFEQQPSKRIDPDQAVAMGAAIQATILDSDASEGAKYIGGTDEEEGTTAGVSLIEVLPQTLGVGLVNDGFAPVIEQGTQLPTTVRKETFSTVDPDQTDVKWPIHQGESDRASENDLLGTLWIRDIPPRAPDQESIAIEFTMTMDGTLEVEVEDLLSGKLIDGTIESGIRLSPNEIEEMSDELPHLE
jgi:molecular chaperone DnaK